MVILSAMLILGLFIHYLYQAFFLPILQTKFKYQLFALRDELRVLRNANGREEFCFAYDYLQSAINVSLTLAESIDLLFLFKTRKIYKENEGLRKTIDERLKRFALCDDHRAHDIHNRVNTALESMLFANIGGLLFYGVSIFFLIFCIGKAKEWITRIQFMPESNMLEIASS